MVTKEINNFNLQQICDSGQCFRMERVSEKCYRVIAHGRFLEILQEGEQCTFFCTQQEFEEIWSGYFDLETDYQSYIESISPKDSYLLAAAGWGSGIRILRQMIVSFLISQQNHITRIRKCIRNLCEAYGEERKSDSGEVFYTFPGPEKLAGLDEDALKACNLGYRSKYVVRTAKSIAEGEVDLEEIRQLPYAKVKKELLKLFGVGEKVADCICLFALHHLQAFPVDTHISQALQKHYKRGFPNRRYKGMQGVMQQYIFYYELTGKKEV
nr:DNA glycosylase [uncultured Faecalimonas sp.]